MSSAPFVECRRKLKSGRSFGTGFSGKGNWNGEVVVLEELEVVEAVGEKGRFRAKVYGVEVKWVRRREDDRSGTECLFG